MRRTAGLGLAWLRSSMKMSTVADWVVEGLKTQTSPRHHAWTPFETAPSPCPTAGTYRSTPGTVANALPATITMNNAASVFLIASP